MARSSRSRPPRRSAPRRERSPQEVAEAFGTERDTVRRWIEDGCPADPPPKGARGRGAAWRLNEEEVQAWLEERGLRLPGERMPHNAEGGRPDEALAGAAGDLKDPKGRRSFAQQWKREKLRKERALRRLNELKLERARGEVIGREEHERDVLAAIETVRTVMLSVPRKYAALLAGLEEAEARAVLTRIVTELLNAFAGKLR